MNSREAFDKEAEEIILEASRSLGWVNVVEIDRRMHVSYGEGIVGVLNTKEMHKLAKAIQQASRKQLLKELSEKESFQLQNDGLGNMIPLIIRPTEEE